MYEKPNQTNKRAHTTEQHKTTNDKRVSGKIYYIFHFIHVLII